MVISTDPKTTIDGYAREYGPSYQATGVHRGKTRQKCVRTSTTYVTRSGKMRRKSRFGVLELLSDPESPQNYL